MHAYARLFRCIASLLFVVVLSCASLRADVGLVLYESIGGGINGWTGSGHAALYFSNLCAETPTKIRLCRPGEAGSVVSNYTSLGEDFGYEWNAVPIEVAFYGVSNPAQQPLLAWPALRQALQEKYRRSHLSEICAGTRCISNPDAEWRDLVATTFVRDSYVFLAKTTLAQDATIMQWLNSSPNVNHYNGFTNNCADFAARVLNTYFPGSARGDHMNDFAITSPKAIAKSFTHYARKHPALQLRVVRFTQIPGTFHASTDAKKGTEALFTSKRWLFPLLLRPHELAFFAGSYLLTGRFNPERELRHQPAAALPHSQSPVPAAQPLRKGPSEAVPVGWVPKPAAVHELAPSSAPGNAGKAKPSAAAVLGSSHAWARYAAAFRELTDEAIQKGLITSRVAPRRVVDLVNSDGRIWFDSQGAAWIDFTGEDGTSRRVGLTAGNITSRDSNPRIAYMIMLARVGTMLDRLGKNREPMAYFEQDWDLLLQARARLWPVPELASDFACCGLESFASPLLEKVSCGSPTDPLLVGWGGDGGSNHAALRSAAASSCLSRIK